MNIYGHHHNGFMATTTLATSMQEYMLPAFKNPGSAQLTTRAMSILNI